jgi:hypothetical protein
MQVIVYVRTVMYVEQIQHITIQVHYYTESLAHTHRQMAWLNTIRRSNTHYTDTNTTFYHLQSTTVPFQNDSVLSRCSQLTY